MGQPWQRIPLIRSVPAVSPGFTWRFAASCGRRTGPAAAATGRKSITCAARVRRAATAIAIASGVPRPDDGLRGRQLLAQPTSARHWRTARGRWSRHLTGSLRPSPQNHLLHVRLPLRHQRAHRRTARSATSRATATIRSTAACSAAKAPPASCSTTRRRGCASRCCASANAAPANSAKSNGTRRLRSPPSGWRESAQTDPKKLAFFTGRDQSQALTGWWAQQFGTPNYAAHGGFCSVNMAAGGPVHHRRQLLGIRRARLGTHPLFHAVRRRRRPRLQSDQDRPGQAEGTRRQSGRDQSRAAPATAPSPTNGSASGRAPTACWRWR